MKIRFTLSPQLAKVEWNFYELSFVIWLNKEIASGNYRLSPFNCGGICQIIIKGAMKR